MNGNVKKVIFILIGILIIGIILFFILKNKNQEPKIEEYEPQEEISTQQERQTMISLYFINKNTRAVEPEARLIDVKDLISNPYGILVNLLIAGPKNENLETAIPEGTRVIKTELKDDVLYVDLSKEFIDNHKGGEEAENLSIYSIVNTVTELNEVNSVKILINGREDQSFNDNKINFRDAFVRIEKETTRENAQGN